MGNRFIARHLQQKNAHLNLNPLLRLGLNVNVYGSNYVIITVWNMMPIYLKCIYKAWHSVQYNVELATTA